MTEAHDYRMLRAKLKRQSRAQVKPPQPARILENGIDIMRPPDDALRFPESDFVMLYYGATNKSVRQLPDQAIFLVVEPPNPFVHEDSELHTWRVVTFRVNKPRFSKMPMFSQVGQRQLTPDEIDYFRPIQEAICKS